MTGWIRYRICDKSGGGWKKDKWAYEPWLCEDEELDEVREHIIHTRESWAIHADRYSFEAEVNAKPPIDVVEKEIAKRERKIVSILKSIEDLESSI